MTENEISTIVIGLAIEVHSTLGPGLLEKAYLECLYYEIDKFGLKVEKDKPVPLVYEGVELICGYRLDLLVENKLVIELKSVEYINDKYFSQLLTYLRLGNYKLGLLINFNEKLLAHGIKRVANRL